MMTKMYRNNQIFWWITRNWTEFQWKNNSKVPKKKNGDFNNNTFITKNITIWNGLCDNNNNDNGVGNNNVSGGNNNNTISGGGGGKQDIKRTNSEPDRINIINTTDQTSKIEQQNNHESTELLPNVDIIDKSSATVAAASSSSSTSSPFSSSTKMKRQTKMFKKYGSTTNNGMYMSFACCLIIYELSFSVAAADAACINSFPFNSIRWMIIIFVIIEWWPKKLAFLPCIFFLPISIGFVCLYLANYLTRKWQLSLSVLFFFHENLR